MWDCMAPAVENCILGIFHWRYFIWGLAENTGSNLTCPSTSKTHDQMLLLNHIPSREVTYPTLGKGKSSTQKCLCWFPGSKYSLLLRTKNHHFCGENSVGSTNYGCFSEIRVRTVTATKWWHDAYVVSVLFPTQFNLKMYLYWWNTSA